VLNHSDLVHHRIQGCGEHLVHCCRLVSLDEIGLVAVTLHQAFKGLVADAGEQGRVGDLVAVQVQDG